MAKEVPRDFFYALVVISILTLGLTTIFSMFTSTNLGDGDLVNPDTVSNEEIQKFNRTFNVETSLSPKVENLQEQISLLAPNNIVEVATLPLAFMQTAWSLILLIVGSFGFLGNAIAGISGYLGMPVWFGALISISLGIFIVFSILSLLFGKDT